MIDDACVMRMAADEAGTGDVAAGEAGRDRYLLRPQPANHERVKAWLRALGDGYTLFDRQDLFAKVEGPIIVEDLRQTEDAARRSPLVVQGPRAAAVVEAAGLPEDVQVFYYGAGHVELAVPPAAAQAVYTALARRRCGAGQPGDIPPGARSSPACPTTHATRAIPARTGALRRARSTTAATMGASS